MICQFFVNDFFCQFAYDVFVKFVIKKTEEKL